MGRRMPGRLDPRDRADVQPGRGDAGDRRAPGHRRIAGADDDSDAGRRPCVADYDLSSLLHLVYGASPISEALLERARKVFPAVGFTQGYGMTELSPVATLLTPADHDNPALRRSAGRAAPHVEVRIVDPDGHEVPRGEVGEVVVRGDNVMLGYWNRPDDTAAAVRDGWMHTGDGGRMDENGYVFIVDRIKDMIITGGENVYSAEVENALAKHPAVAAVAVIGVPDPDWGERVHAVVVLLPGQNATEDSSARTARHSSRVTKLPAASTSSTQCRCPEPARSLNANSANSIGTTPAIRCPDDQPQVSARQRYDGGPAQKRVRPRAAPARRTVGS